MNKTIISGFISKEIKPNESNKVGTATIAVKRPYPFNKDAKGNQVTDFFNLRFVGEKNVTRAAQWLTVGVSVSVEGIVCRDSWKDQEGKWRENNYIMVQNWEFQTAKKDNPNPETEGADFLPSQSEYAPPKAPDEEGFMDIPGNIGEDLPFRK